MVLLSRGIDQRWKVTFGGSYSYCRQCRHTDMLSPSPPHPPYCRKLLSIVPLCRKFHSSPRPSAFYLSIGYFLSDSEALALPKCRTFIYAMEPTKRKRVLLTVEQKFQIVSRIEAGNTLTKLSKEFGIWSAASNGKSAKLRKTLKCVNDEELDNVLYKWFI
ncbi:hypothetical protein AVEN_229956-1 [Araneus ventricosus]|uniref:Uncharacterized protein n=1 Tax=Araneus ventricosus TaxID=182803 RepID=A0A4Y2BYV7_ARAVE|nr:hypothetical protein AVEN_229956-1 [Araneus ventricosus]